MAIESTTLSAFDASRKPLSALEKLPSELISAIAQYFYRDDILSLRLTCKTLNHDMDREMRRLLKYSRRGTSLDVSTLGNLKWIGQRRIAKSVTRLHFHRPPISRFMEAIYAEREAAIYPELTNFDKAHMTTDEIWDMYEREHFIPAADKALEGFENLEHVSFDLWSPAEVAMPEYSDIHWGCQAFSRAVHGLKKRVNLMINTGTYRCEITPPGRNRSSDKVTIDGPFDLNDYDCDCIEQMPPSMISGTFDALWRAIKNDFLGERLSPSILRFQSIYLCQIYVYRVYRPSEAPDILSLEGVVERESRLYRESIDDSIRLFAFQALVSHPNSNLRELSMVNCAPRFRKASWIPFFEALRKHKHLQKLHFEDVDGVRFDWDMDGTLDDGSTRLQGIIEELGMEKALEKMIHAYRNPYLD